MSEYETIVFLERGNKKIAVFLKVGELFSLENIADVEIYE